MGKMKRNRGYKKNQMAPTGLPSVKDCQELEEPCYDTGISGTVLNLVDKLQSTSPDERECTCSTIANLVSQAGAIPQFLGAGAVKVIGPLLVDQSDGVRQAALGALRNMTVDGGPEVCEAMVQQDVMTPLVALLQKYGPDWNKDEKDREVLHQSLHLLWNLCEASPVAVQIVNQQKLLTLLFPFLLPSIHDDQVAVTAAQCVYTISEDNSEAVDILSKPEVTGELLSLLGTEAHNTHQKLFRVLIAGILHNVSKGHLSSLGGQTVCHVIDILVAVLTEDLNGQYLQISQFLQNIKKEESVPPHNGNCAMEEDVASAEATPGDCSGEQFLEEAPDGIGEDESPDLEHARDKFNNTADNSLEIKYKALDMMLEETHRQITAQQLAVEMVANLCCDDEDDDWEDLEISDSSSDDFSTETTEEMDEPDSVEESLCLQSEVRTAFIKSGIIPQVFNKVTNLDVDLEESLKSSHQCKRLYTSLVNLQLRALLCTGNLVSCLEVDDLGGLDTLHQLWIMLSKLSGSTAMSEALDSLEGATSALRAVVEKLGESDSPQILKVEDTDLQFLYKLGTQCSHPQVRTNAIRIVATIGCELAAHEQFNLLKSICEFLYQVASQDTEAWVVAETLDAMFDVFADDKTDAVIQEFGLVAKLKDIVPALKEKVQQQKKRLGEHHAIVSTARNNLARFIKYKARRPNAT